MSADEFDVIRRLFAPLATNAAARGLRDDVAVLQAQGALVITTDAIVEGVHFLADDPLDTVAQKALRVNLSDLAAKGARPLGIVLSLIWPQARPSAQIETFAAGLARDLAHYDVALLGGDTTATPGPLTISVTAFGAPHGKRTPARSAAQVGDDVWVTGEIGDGHLGLLSLTEAPDDAAIAPARVRYRTPEPPVAFAPAIARFARASADVSDGLVADAGNIAAASGVRIVLEAMPLSASGRAFVAKHGEAGLVALATGGDDYQALFTADPEAAAAIADEGARLGTAVTRIGRVEAGEGVVLFAPDGQALQLPVAGHRHRLGR